MEAATYTTRARDLCNFESEKCAIADTQLRLQAGFSEGPMMLGDAVRNLSGASGTSNGRPESHIADRVHA